MAPTTRSARRSTLRSYTRWYNIDPSGRSASSSPIQKLAPKRKKSPVKGESTPYCTLVNTSLPLEILEAIFLQLNRKIILVSAQRVCRYWYAIIKNSIALQEMLLFRPATAPRIEVCQNDKIFLRIFGCMLRSQSVPYPELWMYKKRGNWLRPEANWRSMVSISNYVPAMACIRNRVT